MSLFECVTGVSEVESNMDKSFVDILDSEEGSSSSLKSCGNAAIKSTGKENVSCKKLSENGDFFLFPKENVTQVRPSLKATPPVTCSRSPGLFQNKIYRGRSFSKLPTELNKDQIHNFFRKQFNLYLFGNKVECDWTEKHNRSLEDAMNFHLDDVFLSNLYEKKNLGYGESVGLVFVRFLNYIVRCFDCKILTVNSLLDMKSIGRNPQKNNLYLTIVDRYVNHHSIEYRLCAIVEELNVSIPRWLNNNHTWFQRKLLPALMKSLYKMVIVSGKYLKNMIFEIMQKYFNVSKIEFNEMSDEILFEEIQHKLAGVISIAAKSCKLHSVENIKTEVENYANVILHEITARTHAMAQMLIKYKFSDKEEFVGKLMTNLTLALDWTILGKGIV